MNPQRGWCKVQTCPILFAFLALAGAGLAWAEQASPPWQPAAPPAPEPPGVVVEMGPAEPRAPARLAPPGATPSPALSTLAGEIRSLRERVEVLERTLTGLLEARPVVASGMVEVPPSGRQPADPIAEPLGFARLQPGQTTLRHGLGAAEVTIHLAVLSAEGRLSYQVPVGALFASAPTPPNGTFTIFNATESPLSVRWWAILQPAPGHTATGEETPE